MYLSEFQKVFVRNSKRYWGKAATMCLEEKARVVLSLSVIKDLTIHSNNNQMKTFPFPLNPSLSLTSDATQVNHMSTVCGGAGPSGHHVIHHPDQLQSQTPW